MERGGNGVVQRLDLQFKFIGPENRGHTVEIRNRLSLGEGVLQERQLLLGFQSPEVLL